jgi:hypothetical protein
MGVVIGANEHFITDCYPGYWRNRYPNSGSRFLHLTPDIRREIE